MNAQPNQQELLLWNASSMIEACLDNNLRNELVDYLSPVIRAKLFDGYVLQEHYDYLAQKYDIAKMSSNIQQQVIERTW